MLNDAKYLIIHDDITGYTITNKMHSEEGLLYRDVERLLGSCPWIKEVRVCELGTTIDFVCSSVLDFHKKWKEAHNNKVPSEDLIRTKDIAKSICTKEDLKVYNNYTSRRYTGKRMIVDLCGDEVAYKVDNLYGISSCFVEDFLAWVNGDALV